MEREVLEQARRQAAILQSVGLLHAAAEVERSYAELEEALRAAEAEAVA
ncbi:MAG TPA: hypothetical protein VHO01_15665 [Jatrophihabitans sp.]|nr:hypothetical protein [Jatrophihabitans sp.]